MLPRGPYVTFINALLRYLLKVTCLVLKSFNPACFQLIRGRFVLSMYSRDRSKVSKVDIYVYIVYVCVKVFCIICLNSSYN